MAFDRQPFASTHPAIDALFNREFAQSQAQRQAEAQAMANATARAQIQAQSELAQAQQQANLQQQQYNNLFRESELKSRNRQLDIDEMYKKGILNAPDPRAAIDAERLKSNIAATNAAAKAAALRFGAAYDTALEAAITKKKEDEKDSLWGFRGWRPGAETGIDTKWDDPKNPDRLLVEEKIWQDTLNALKKDPEVQLVIPDVKMRTFRPAQVDASGNLIMPAGTTATVPSNPAALGVTPATTIPTTTGTTSTGGLGPEAGALFQLGEPIVRRAIGSTADMFSGNVSSAPMTPTPTQSASVATVQIPIGGGTMLEVSTADADEAERQLRAVPPEQRPDLAAAIRDTLLKSGRARSILTEIPMTMY